MLRRILILDLVLTATLVMGVVRFRQAWIVFGQDHQAAKIQPRPENFQPIAAATAGSAPGSEDWTDIPSRNLFSFDRTDIAIVAPAEPSKPPGPRPVLFGTMSLGQERLAMLGPGQSGNRSYRAMKVGDVIDGWTVVEIQEKAAVIAANEIRETIIMSDPTAQIPRDYSRTAVTSSPVPQVVLPSAPPAASNNSSPSSSPSNGAAPRQRVIQTPFGPKTITEE